MSFLIDHYKGKYRLLVPYNKNTNQFSRTLDGKFEDIDVYISCEKGTKIYYYGKSILEAYIPSAIRGKNIIKQIQDEFGDDIISNIIITNAEVIFRFHSKKMEQLESILKPKKSGSSISPFSSKNIKKMKYSIPEDELSAYKNIIENIPKERILELSHITNNYIKSLESKSNTYENIKNDMALKRLKGKEYIHSIGKWNEYVEYLDKNIKL